MANVPSFKPTDPWTKALGRVSSGMYVLSLTHEGQETGMLASWLVQAAFTPPMVTAAIGNDRPVKAWLTPGAKVVVNVLAADDKTPLKHFGKGFAPGEDAFAGIETDRRLAAAPVLACAVAWLECEVAGSVEAGDHTVFTLKVLKGDLLSDRGPALHVRHTGLHY